jgi:hypothetical protein
MAGPTTLFTADESQALLDLLERCFNELGARNVEVHATEEETIALGKLTKAAEFYNPLDPQNTKES